MPAFSENDLELASLQWFEELGYSIIIGPTIAPDGEYPERSDYAQVVLEDRLRNALQSINQGIPSDSIDEAVRKILIQKYASLTLNNKEFHKMINDGVDVDYQRPDGSLKNDKVWLFDFKNPENNDWLAVNQFTVIENKQNKRPDLVIFVNGFPLVVIELKSSSDENVSITEGYNQLQTYKNVIPSLFVYNAFVVTSDGINARVGTITSAEDWFMMWRTIEGEDVAPSSIMQLEVLIKGMFEKNRFLDLIKYFIVFQSDGSEITKILAGYHQYHAVNKAVMRTSEAIDVKGDRKIGVIWHTQGSGKSLSMVFYTGKLVLGLNNPTIVVLTDRNDLDDQLFGTFSKSAEFLRQTPKQADNRKNLRELLSTGAGGIIFTTIQKFSPGEDGDDEPLINDRRNIIVIADEAHRSQYGLSGKMETTKNEAEVKFGYAKYMRDALPNASFIAFTGTPVELTDKNTQAVFGDYIDVYDMSRAVADGTTVKIYYESRIAKLDLSEDERPKIDKEFEEITENQEDTERETNRSKWSRLEAIVGTEKRIKMIANDIVEHFETRQKAIIGKAMVVAMSRRIAIKLYQEIVALRPDWHNDDDDKGVIKIVMTGSSSDPQEWQKYIGSKGRRKELAKRFKKPDDPFKIVIVRDMWLTGFDVPCMTTMYIDKPMSGHNLMQAIARVNRVFRDKPGGLIVDYIGIAENLKDALAQYSPGDRRTAGIDTSVAVDIMLEKYELIEDLLYGFSYSKYLSDNPVHRMKAIVETMDYIIGLGEDKKKEYLQLVTEIAKAYALCSTTLQAAQINIEIAFFKAVKAGIVKIIPEGKKKKTKQQIDYELQQLISKSVITEDLVDVFAAAGLTKPNIAILSDEFLEEVRGLKQKNLAVELLKRLLENRIRFFAKRNLVQSKAFSEKLKGSISKYNNRVIETAIVLQELIELAKEMNERSHRGENLGLNDDELAFYDALGSNDAAVKIMGDDILKQIARDLTRTIKNSVGVDWSIRESVRAKMRITIKHLLKKYGYPPDKQEQAVKTVMEQAELMCGNEADMPYAQEESFGYAKVAEEE